MNVLAILMLAAATAANGGAAPAKSAGDNRDFVGQGSTTFGWDQVAESALTPEEIAKREAEVREFEANYAALKAKRPTDWRGSNELARAVFLSHHFFVKRLEWRQGLAHLDRMVADFPWIDAGEVLARRAASAHKLADNRLYDACIEKLAANYTGRQLNALAAIVHRHPFASGCLGPALAKRFAHSKDPEEINVLKRAQFMNGLNGLRGSRVRTKPSQLKRVWGLYDELRKANVLGPGDLAYCAESMVALGDFPGALRLSEELLEADAKKGEKERMKREYYERLRTAGINAALTLKRFPEALRRLEEQIAEDSCPTGKVFTARVFAAYARAKSVDEFKASVLALRPEGVGDELYFDLLRNAQRPFLHLVLDREGSRYARALVEVSQTFEREEETLHYDVRFAADAPRSAEAAYLADVFGRKAFFSGKYDVERRFAPYRAANDLWRKDEKRLLKCRPEMKLGAGEDGRGIELVALAAPEGLHFYLRVEDPDGWKRRAWAANASWFEFYVLPGENADRDYHVSSNSRGVQPFGDVENCTTAPGRRLTRDCVKSDAIMYDDAMYLHGFVSWTQSYEELPRNDDPWTLVVYTFCGGRAYTVGGGALEEFGRGLKLDFKLSDDDRLAIRRYLLRTAVGEYRRVRGKWENAEFWSDPHVGDRPFFAAVVKPYLDEMDAVAKDIVSTRDLSAEQVVAFEKYLPDLMDFRLTLDAKREKWLDERLFTR